MSRSDEHFMRRAVAVARRARNIAYPNPAVGALVVKNDKVVGVGFHNGPGTAHAEVVALAQAGSKSTGATIFVTLEPCNHFGKTPPCVDAIIASGITRVVVARRDLNPNVKGGGVERLRAAGIEVVIGVCEELAAKLLAPWERVVTYKVPYLTLKLAISKDRKIAFPGNEPRWLSGPIARAQVQRVRSECDAIMIGSATALIDDPQLTNRSGRGRDPLKVVLSSTAKLPTALKLFTGSNPLVFCSADAEPTEIAKLTSVGAGVVTQLQPGKVEVAQVLAELARRGIISVLCEGGAKLATTLVKQRLANKIFLYQTSHEIGEGGVDLAELFSANNQISGYSLSRRQRVGQDVLLTYDLC